jgi:hypothetical protein
MTELLATDSEFESIDSFSSALDESDRADDVVAHDESPRSVVARL